MVLMNMRKAESKRRRDSKRTLSGAQEQLFNQLVNELAEKKSLTPSRILQNQQKPRFLQAAERRARELGITPDEVLSGDLKAMRESSYPTSDCLTPDEVEHFRNTGGLPAQREQHSVECEICKTMIEVTTPDPARVEEILEEVRSSTYAVSNSKIAAMLDKLLPKMFSKVVKPEVENEAEARQNLHKNEFTKA